jgi:hypothetical protein
MSRPCCSLGAELVENEGVLRRGLATGIRRAGRELLLVPAGAF